MKKELLFLLACLSLLSFFLYKTLLEGRWLSTTPGDKATKVLAHSPQARQESAIQRIELRRPEDIIVFEHSPEGRWRIVNPIDAKPDAGKLEAIIDLLLSKESPARLRIPIGDERSTQSDALNAGGMRSPELGIVFFGDFGEERLWLGQVEPREEGVYARWIRTNYIELLPKPIYDLLCSSVDNLRERRVFHDPKHPIQAVSLKRRGVSLELLDNGKAIYRYEDADGGSQEIMHRMDGALHKRFWEHLEGMQCVAFWDSEPRVLGREKLLEVTVKQAQTKPITWVLENVSTVKGEKIVLSTPSVNTRYLMQAETTFRGFRDDPTWILDKNWMGISPEECRYLSVASLGQKLEVSWQDNAWKMGAPSYWNVDRAKVKAFFNRLHAMKILGLSTLPVQSQETDVEKDVADSIRLELGKGIGNVVRVRIWKADGQWNMHREGENFAYRLGVVPPELEKDIQPLDWRDRVILEVSPAQVKELHLIRPGSSAVFVKEEKGWGLRAPRAGKADPNALLGLFSELLPLRVTRFLASEERERVGVFTSHLELVLVDGKGPHTLSIGQDWAEGVLARVQEGELFLLAPETVAPLLRDPIFLVAMLREDVNQDGTPDQWVHYRGGKRWAMESDDDADGAIDTRTYWRYNAQGNLIRMDTDTNNDGVIDQRTYFSDGKPYRQEDDTDGNGRVDVWTTFARGMQASQRLDSNNDGRPDLHKRILRSVEGTITGAEVDQDLDGNTDYLERYKGNKILREILAPTPR